MNINLQTRNLILCPFTIFRLFTKFEKVSKIVAKELDGQRGTRCPFVSICGCVMVRGAALGLNLSINTGIGASRLGVEPRGWELSLEVGI